MCFKVQFAFFIKTWKWSQRDKQDGGQTLDEDSNPLFIEKTNENKCIMEARGMSNCDAYFSDIFGILAKKKKKTLG